MNHLFIKETLKIDYCINRFFMQLNIHNIYNINQIRSDYILLFDLDGTLVDTDLANNSVYRYAIREVMGEECLALNQVKRITRTIIQDTIPVSQEQLERIIDIKRRCFHFNLNMTSLMETFFILKKHYLHNDCYIVTSAERCRADEILNYYDFKKYVKDIIYVNGENKYNNISSKLNKDSDKIILFEDNENAIQSAIDNGIYQEHIIDVTRSNLKTFTIQANEFLSQQTLAFHKLYYIGYNKPKNPDFINIIKNQFDNTPQYSLELAIKSLYPIVFYDIAHLYHMMRYKELIVVTIPRAKSEYAYSPNQQLFRRVIQIAVNRLREKYGMNIVDGTQVFIRHTDTKTTHLAKCTSIENTGDLPYPGITTQTCHISTDVIKEKCILLIDDIYTANVNIDEDAIQALYNAGAQNVIFYSICKTSKI